MRRELWESLTDIVSAFTPDASIYQVLRIESADITLPIELVMPKTEVGFRFYADATRQRWVHGIRDQSSSLKVSFRTVETEDLSDECSETSPINS